MSVQAIGNWFLFVGQQWLNSLKVFLPKNFKLFIQVTLNAWWQATKIFFKYFWWLIFIKIPISYLDLRFIHNIFFYKFTINFLILFLHSFFLGFALLAVRPSVLQKTLSYFWQYLKHLSYIFLVIILVGIFHITWSFLISGIYNIYWNSLLSLVELGTGTLFPFLVFPTFFHFSSLFIFFAYFFFDSDGSVKQLFLSIIRAIKLSFYSYLFCIVSYLLILLLSNVFSYFAEVTGRLLIVPTQYQFYLMNINVSSNFYLIILFLFYAAWLNTFYRLQLQENFEFYTNP